MLASPQMNGTRPNFIAPFKPLDWQRQPFLDKSPTLLLTGSAGGGKSRIVAEKLHAFCLKYSNAMALAVRKTRESMTNSTVLYLERSIIGRDSRVKHVSQKHRFEYQNGSILAYGGMKDDDQREQIRSIGQEGGLDLVWMEEAIQFTEDDYNEIKARMRGKAADWRQIILTTNPGAPSHWIYQNLIAKGLAKVYYSNATDNLYNPEDYRAQLDGLTGILGERLRDGKWKQAEGAIYTDYDVAIHLIDPFEIPQDWRRIRVIDFGFVNPFVCQWWALHPDGAMFLYREIYMTQRTVREHAIQINALSGDEFYECTVADHDAEDRATLAESGIDTVPAIKEVSPGIQAVQQRLKPQGANQQPRIFLMRGALVELDSMIRNRPTCTAEEVEGYVWEKSAEGKPLKDQPHKEDDHGMDALRYAVKQIDSGLTGQLFF